MSKAIEILNATRDEAETVINECNQAIRAIQRAAGTLPFQIALAKAPKMPKIGKVKATVKGKRSPLTLAKMRIGQAKRRGKEPLTEDMALVEGQAAE